jgi:hypothetical protein
LSRYRRAKGIFSNTTKDDRYAEVLGEEAMQQVRKDAVESYRKCYPRINEEDWRVFIPGTQREQDAWRTKLWKEMFPGTQQEGR